MPVALKVTPSRRADTKPHTFDAQERLPRLPVPDVQETMGRYLRSVEPILRQAEEFGELGQSSAAAELKKREQWAAQFLESGLAQRLNNRLVDVDHTSPDNWFDDRFWIKKAYHEWRAPLLINSNWWVMFQPDKSMPPEIAGYLGDAPAGSPKANQVQNWDNMEWGVRRATWLLYRMLHFKLQVDREDLQPDASRMGAFCMHQYRHMFGVTRLPQLPRDYNTNAAGPNAARHITVLCRDHVYELPVLDDGQDILPLSSIEAALRDIIADARKNDGVPIGLLSADNRDAWTKSREDLLMLGQQNRDNLTSIETSLFVLALDSNVLGLPEGRGEPEHGCAPRFVDAVAFNTAGSGRLGHNRFFDKALTLIVEPNGQAGMMGEHSPVDALIPSFLCDYALNEPMPPPSEPFPENLDCVTKLDASPTWTKLHWTTDNTTQNALRAAEKTVMEIAAESDISTLWYDEYGAEWIKRIARQAPDAYLQMALQLAFASTTGRQSATYETASTRLFRHGRTDVIRSFSNEAYDFVRGVRENKPATELYKLLSAATHSHSNQTREHSFGKGIDRHLAGLRLVYRPEDGEYPALFSDPLFAESQTWKLSTSGLSAGDNFTGTGFGCGFPDGLGINYLAGASVLKFGMEAKRGNPHAPGPQPTAVFAGKIVEAMRKMREIVEQGQPEVPGQQQAKHARL